MVLLRQLPYHSRQTQARRKFAEREGQKVGSSGALTIEFYCGVVFEKSKGCYFGHIMHECFTVQLYNELFRFQLSKGIHMFSVRSFYKRDSAYKSFIGVWINFLYSFLVLLAFKRHMILLCSGNRVDIGSFCVQ